MKTLDDVVAAVRERPMKTVAVAVAEHESVLGAIRQAAEMGIAEAVLVGGRDEIAAAAEKAELDLNDVAVIDQPSDLAAAAVATDLVRTGRADILMKGNIHTDDFLRAVLDKERGLRSGAIMSHVFLLETTHLDRLTMVTDGAMNIAPDLVTKAEIILNAVYLARVFGIDRPQVGVLAATELVNPKMPATIDAAVLSKMSRRRQFPDCIVDGPFALDNAVSALAAQIKRIDSEVAGACDILLVPEIEAGNMLAKSFVYFAQGRVAGVLVGASAPVVLTSRADSAEAKLYSIAAGMLMADLKRTSRLKIGKVHF
ncbi:MAG: bifunctional enoyl-CoA hydratase/phosphate acetyltransferase [Armatimonadetes bacterium]|nr:bifunctional enoyl-CoA hydratase/phosphate acetyltransferase [Armatimonadota bacterium]